MLWAFCLDWLILTYGDGRNSKDNNNGDKKREEP